MSSALRIGGAIASFVVVAAIAAAIGWHLAGRDTPELHASLPFIGETGNHPSALMPNSASALHSREPASTSAIPNCVDLWNTGAGAKKAQLNDFEQMNHTDRAVVALYQGHPFHNTYNAANSSRDVGTLQAGNCVVVPEAGGSASFGYVDGRWITLTPLFGDPLFKYLNSPHLPAPNTIVSISPNGAGGGKLTLTGE